MARKLEVEIIGDASSLHRALNQSTGSTSRFGGVLGKLKTAALGAGVAVAGGLAVGLEKSIHAAIESQAVHARLGVAFKNVGLNVKNYSDKIDEAEAKGRKLGFTDDQTANSLGSLITATGDYGKAVKDLGVAQDIARFKGVNLQDATKMLTMAMTGSQRAAKQLGITVPTVSSAYDKLKASGVDLTTAEGKAEAAHAKLMDKFATGQAVIDAVTAKVHGQADAYSKTASGAMEQFRAQLNHIEIEIGNKLLPILVAFIKWVTTHWPEISATVTTTWNQMRPSLVAFGDTVKQLTRITRENWNIIGPIWRAGSAVVQAILANMTVAIRVLAALLKGDWAGAWHAAKQTASADAKAIGAAVSVPLNAVRAAIESVISGIKSLISWFNHKFAVPAINAVIGAFNALYSAVMAVVHAVEALISALGRIHVPHVHLPHVPGLAAGGSVTRSGLAMVGEHGPEILALPGGASVIPLSSSSTGGGGKAMVVQLVLDGKQLAEVLIDPMRGQAQIYKQRTGRQAFA